MKGVLACWFWQGVYKRAQPTFSNSHIPHKKKASAREAFFMRDGKRIKARARGQ